MIQKEVKCFVKKKKGHLTKREIYLIAAVGFLALTAGMPCVAYASADAVTGKINVLKDIVAAFVSAVGVIITLWGIFEWGNSLQSQDGAGQAHAFKRIGGGLIMIIAPQLLTALI